MNKGFIGTFSFMVGIGVGYFIARKTLHEACEQMIQKEVEEVKAAFKKREAARKKDEKTEKVQENESEDQSSMKAYRDVIAKQKYKKDSDLHSMAEKLRPRIITPDEFGEKKDFDCITLTFYQDDVIANDQNMPMADVEIETALGHDAQTIKGHFGEYEEDSVFIRNEMLKIDYEILMDERTYKQMLEAHPELR